MSIHYDALFLCDHLTRLYQGFRETLIDIQKPKFAYGCPSNGNPTAKVTQTDIQIKAEMAKTNQRFEQYFKQDPLRLVWVAKRQILTASSKAKNVITRIDRVEYAVEAEPGAT